MSNGGDVLDNWEEIDEAGLSMTLQTKLQIANEDNSTKLKHTTKVEPSVNKMKLLQRPQSLQEGSSRSTGSMVTTGAPKQIMIAKKPSSTSLDADVNSTAPVLMVLHKSNNEYDSASYATPISNQTVKILRRPAQAEERRDSNGIRPKQPIKTLQQREQEYAQARLRIMGSAKNPEDDKPATPAPPSTGISTTAAQQGIVSTVPADLPATAVNFNNNINGMVTSSGMHRSSSAPKMSQQAAPIYNNYNNYYQAPVAPAALSYYYQQQTPPLHQQQQAAPLPHHYNQRMPPYVTGAAAQVASPSANPQQSWSPVVGGSVSAALLRQSQSMHSTSVQQQQHHQQHQQQSLPPQYVHAYSDNVLRLPRGPCPNGTIGFQMRR